MKYIFQHNIFKNIHFTRCAIDKPNNTMKINQLNKAWKKEYLFRICFIYELLVIPPDPKQIMLNIKQASVILTQRSITISHHGIT